MASITAPILDQLGKYSVDRSIIPKVRKAEIEFSAHDLRPYSNCNFFLNDQNINQFIEPATTLQIGGNTWANTFSSKEGLYCNTTGAYCTVIDSSLGNVLYVNENYLSLNLIPYGPLNSNNFVNTTYNIGDLVYLANNTQNSYSNTFLGSVVYWNSGQGTIALKVRFGVPTNTAGNNVLFKISSSQLSNVANITQGSLFPVGTTLNSTSNITNTFNIAAYDSNHGIVLSSNANAQLIISGILQQNVINSNIQLVTGYGIGQNAAIIAVNNNVVNLSSTLAYAPYIQNPPSTVSYYSVAQPIVNDVGKVCGILQIPEDVNFSFDSGDLLFTINDQTQYDSANASMRAIAIYAAIGQIAGAEATTPIVTLTPTITAASNSMVIPTSVTTTTSPLAAASSTDPQASLNPMAQTFYVPTPNTGTQNYGIFVSSINLFFQNAPVGSSIQFPVTVRIVETEYGYPTSTVLGSSTVDWANIKVTSGYNANSNTSSYPDSANSSTYTNFAFSDPIYLNPGTEYAIVVYSESPDYKVWTSTIGNTIVNSTRLVSQIPFVGSFFQAQNASVWTAIPNQQLMFVLNKAQFSDVPTTLQFNITPQSQNIFMDMTILHSADLTFPAANITYQMLTTLANTGQQDLAFFNIDPNIPYNFGSDLKNSTIGSNRRRIINGGNANSIMVQAIMSTQNPDISPMFNRERFGIVGITNIINPGSISNSDITITSGGAHLNNVANIIVVFSSPTGEGGTQATANVSLAVNGASYIVSSINIINPGSGYVTTPTITINQIGSTNNAAAVVYGEDQLFGGNGATRYVTRQITLASGFDSGDLVVYLNCVRPQGTDIQCYYKVVSGQSTVPLSGSPWRQMSKVADVFSPDQNTIIPLEFNTGGKGVLSYISNGITYPLGGKFKSFAIKLVMLASDPTVPPLINSFGAVCVPAG